MTRSKLYERAAALLEEADERMTAAPTVGKPHDRDAYGRYWWSLDNRVVRWKACDWLACLIADRVVTESARIAVAERLADRARQADDVSALAKAAAARVQMTRAVWTEAYGRYFAKWEREFIV